MAGAVCPSCNKALPPSVMSGPPQAVVRCEGCQTLLLWSNGRVMRSAKSSTPTVQGMPAVGRPREEDSPLTALQPEAETKTIPAPVKPAAAPVPTTSTQPLARVVPQKMSVTGLGDNSPTRVTATPAELRKAAPPPPSPSTTRPRRDPTPPPMKVPPSGPIAVKPPSPSGPIAGKPPSSPAAPPPRRDPTPSPMKVPPSGPIAVKPRSEPKPEAKPELLGETTKVEAEPKSPAATGKASEAKTEAPKPSLVAAVAEVPNVGASSGPMVDPAAWFQDGSDVVPPEKAKPLVEAAKPARGDITGAQPLPPPPGMKAMPSEPFVVNAPVDEPKAREELSAPIPLLEPEETNPGKPAALSSSARKYGVEGNAYAPDREAEVFPSESSNEPTEAFAQKLAPEPPPPVAQQPPRPARATVLGIAPPPVAKPSPPLKPSAPPSPPASSVTSTRPERADRTPGPPQPVKPERSDKTPAPPSRTERADKTPAATASKPERDDPTPPASVPAPMTTAPAKAPPTAPTMTAPAPLPALPTLRELNAPGAVVAGDTSAPDLPPPPMPPRKLVEPVAQTDEVVRVGPLSRRTLVMIGSGAGALIVILLLVSALGHKPAATDKPVVKPPVVATTPTPPAATPPTPAPPTRPAPVPPPVPPPATTAPEPVAPVADSDEPPRAPRTHHTLGGKKVVLEYDPKPTSPTPPPPTAPVPTGEDPATVARAREAYHRGNVKLFSGDTEGAIALYRESLKIYPGYVAGYRGLGLGYEQGGKSKEALDALRTYVKTVPNAHDTALIKKRIEHLESVVGP